MESEKTRKGFAEAHKRYADEPEQQLSRSLSRLETQDIKTQPQFNHYLDPFSPLNWAEVMSEIIRVHFLSYPPPPRFFLTGMRFQEKVVEGKVHHWLRPRLSRECLVTKKTITSEITSTRQLPKMRRE